MRPMQVGPVLERKSCVTTPTDRMPGRMWGPPHPAGGASHWLALAFPHKVTQCQVREPLCERSGQGSRPGGTSGPRLPKQLGSKRPPAHFPMPGPHWRALHMAHPPPIQLLPMDRAHLSAPAGCPLHSWAAEVGGAGGGTAGCACVGGHLAPHAPIPIRALLFIHISSDLSMSPVVSGDGGGGHSLQSIKR